MDDRKIIYFELTDDIKKEGIINEFFINVPNSIVIELNHKYEKKIVISRIYQKDWNKTSEIFEKSLREKGITDAHVISKLTDVVYNNYKKILELLNDTQNEDKKEIDFISLVKENCSELFVDQYDSPYAAITINGHTEIISLNTIKFRNWVFNICYKQSGESSSEKVGNTINILKAEAGFSENLKTLDLRVAKTDNFTFYYDLTNSEWSAVKITPEGWTIDKNPPILFRRYNNQRPQTIPTTMFDLDDVFDKFMEF